MNKTIQVRVPYTEGCPNAAPVFNLIEKLSQEIRIPVSTQKIVVSTPEQAAELRFIGSPTIQINGADIDSSACGSMAFGLG